MKTDWYDVKALSKHAREILNKHRFKHVKDGRNEE
jgi:hypothetical protein